MTCRRNNATRNGHATRRKTPTVRKRSDIVLSGGRQLPKTTTCEASRTATQRALHACEPGVSVVVLPMCVRHTISHHSYLFPNLCEWFSYFIDLDMHLISKVISILTCGTYKACFERERESESERVLEVSWSFLSSTFLWSVSHYVRRFLAGSWASSWQVLGRFMGVRVHGQAHGRFLAGCQVGHAGRENKFDVLT